MRMKRMRPINLGDLADMAQIVRSPLIQHLRQRDQAKFRMLRGSRSR
jgi:hypothetical protein